MKMAIGDVYLMVVFCPDCAALLPDEILSQCQTFAAVDDLPCGNLFCPSHHR